jgi:hypothetical protein
MAGLGMYTTDSGKPVDANDKPTDWIIGPEIVIERGQGTTFERINGLSSVEPSQTHAKYLENKAQSIHGISDIATGVAAATESGVALALRLAPLMDQADEIDLVVNDAMNQMFHDLKQWFLIYEGLDFGDTEITSFVDPDARLPLDRTEVFTELNTLFTAGVVDLQYMLDTLAKKLGYEFPSGMQARVEKDAERKAALADPYGTRAAGELANSTNDPNVIDATVVP